MTGTGTQNDPYIPVTLTEFISAVGTSGAYVSLDRDINAADDPNYNGELTSPIDFSCVSLLGDDHFISGVTVRAATLLQSRVASFSANNVFFKNFAHKRTEAGYTLTTTTSDALVMNGCKASVIIDDSGGGNNGEYGFISHCKFTDCALDVKYVNSQNPIILSSAQLLRSTIVVRDCNICGSVYPINDRNSWLITRSAIIFDNCSVYADRDLSYSSSQRYSYVGFLDCEYIADHIKSCGDSSFGVSSLIVCDTPPSQIDAKAGLTVATMEQMKDKEWLMSVGFLP